MGPGATTAGTGAPMTSDPDIALYEELSKQQADEQIRYYRAWLDGHKAEYEQAFSYTTSGKYQTEYRRAVTDALERLRGFAPGKDDATKAVYLVGQAVLILGQAEQPLYTIRQYEKNQERYAKLLAAKELKK